MQVLDHDEPAFRAAEAEAVRSALASPPAVIAIGGGAVETPEVRELLREELVVLLDVDVETAWDARGSDRPLARDETEFRRRYELRQPLYDEVADARARDADDVVLAAAGVHVEVGALPLLRDLVPGRPGRARHRAGRRRHLRRRRAARARFAETHELPSGEAAKQLPEVERLWRALRIGRNGTIVALGGGSLTDAAGFAAATFLRGCAWVPVPDHARRPGRRGDRRQDRDRPPGGQEPRRRLPLARADGDRSRPCSRRCRRTSA